MSHPESPQLFNDELYQPIPQELAIDLAELENRLDTIRSVAHVAETQYSEARNKYREDKEHEAAKESAVASYEEWSAAEESRKTIWREHDNAEDELQRTLIGELYKKFKGKEEFTTDDLLNLWLIINTKLFVRRERDRGRNSYEHLEEMRGSRNALADFRLFGKESEDQLVYTQALFNLVGYDVNDPLRKDHDIETEEAAVRALRDKKLFQMLLERADNYDAYQVYAATDENWTAWALKRLSKFNLTEEEYEAIVDQSVTSDDDVIQKALTEFLDSNITYALEHSSPEKVVQSILDIQTRNVNGATDHHFKRLMKAVGAKEFAELLLTHENGGPFNIALHLEDMPEEAIDRDRLFKAFLTPKEVGHIFEIMSWSDDDVLKNMQLTDTQGEELARYVASLYPKSEDVKFVLDTFPSIDEKVRTELLDAVKAARSDYFSTAAQTYLDMSSDEERTGEHSEQTISRIVMEKDQLGETLTPADIFFLQFVTPSAVEDRARKEEYADHDRDFLRILGEDVAPVKHPEADALRAILDGRDGDADMQSLLEHYGNDTLAKMLYKQDSLKWSPVALVGNFQLSEDTRKELMQKTIESPVGFIYAWEIIDKIELFTDDMGVRREYIQKVVDFDRSIGLGIARLVNNADKFALTAEEKLVYGKKWRDDNKETSASGTYPYISTLRLLPQLEAEGWLTRDDIVEIAREHVDLREIHILVQNRELFGKLPDDIEAAIAEQVAKNAEQDKQ